MSNFKVALIGLLSLFSSLTSGSKCLQEVISRYVVCYYNSETSINYINICNCTHIVFTSAIKKDQHDSFKISEDARKDLFLIKEKKNDLFALFTLEAKQGESSAILKSENRSHQLINEIGNLLRESKFDGVELDFKFTSHDSLGKELYASFVEGLSKSLSSLRRRVKREGYDVFEKLQDDVTTAAYPTQTPKNSTSKAQSIISQNVTLRINRSVTRDDKEDSTQYDDHPVTLKEPTTEIPSTENLETEKNVKKTTSESTVEGNSKFLVFVRLSTQPEIIAKKFDLKALSRYADVLSVPTHNLVDRNEDHLTYHPSRLMGLSDILNTDSLLDLLTGMGAVKSKILISLPATALKFQLKNVTKNTPGSPSTSDPEIIDQSQLCSLFSKNNWTLERDEDLTAPYAFSGKTWLAFEDDTSVNIKGKYILLRELAGGAIYPVDADVNDEFCSNQTGAGGYLTSALYKSFKNLERKPRAVVLQSLQEEIHETTFPSIEAGVKLSEYRIVRVVDNSGAVHVIRKNTKTQFECSRQGYFSHPLGCNKFYRCVKFDQYSDEFTVFEYDCPVGLAFDERWEVCVWPGSLPHGAPCTGSSEIAPVPRSHYQCPNQEGYYADPENCRWFFACLDHARDGLTPLTAYEFRCPFGLVFNQEKLACDWPWLVGSCGNQGSAGYVFTKTGGIRATNFINGGNLEASFGQYGNVEEEDLLKNFGKGFGSFLKERRDYSSQGAGYGYISSQYDDSQKKAPFASLPDFEISGGRILNKGGVVLGQNVNVVEISGSHEIKGSDEVKGLDEVNRYVGSGYHNQQNLQSTYNQGTYQAIRDFYNAPKIKHRVESIPEISKVPVVQTTPSFSNVEQVSVQHPISTPKPFSIGISSVQINENHSDRTFSGPSTPQVTVNIPAFGGRFSQKEKVHIQDLGVKQFTEGDYIAPQSFSVTQPTVSIGTPSVLPKTKIHSFQNIKAEQNGVSEEFSISTPTISAGVIPLKTQTYQFDQSDFKQSGLLGNIPASQRPISVEVSGVGHERINSIGQAAAPYKLPAVTPKPFDYTKDQNRNGELKVAFGFEASTITPEIGIQTFESTRVGQEVSSGVKYGKPTLFTHRVPTATPKTEYNTLEYINSRGVSESVAVKQPTISTVIPLKTEFHTLSYADAGQNLFSEEIFGRKSTASVGVPEVIPKTNEGHIRTSAVSIKSPLNGLTDETLTELSGVSYKVPDVTRNTKIHTLDQKISFQNGEVSSQPELAYSIPTVTSKTEFYTPNQHGSGQNIASQSYVKLNTGVEFNHVTPTVAPIQLRFGQQYSQANSFEQSGKQFTSSKPLVLETSTPRVSLGQNALTVDTSAQDHQPLGPVGSINSNVYGYGALKPESSTSHYFIQNTDLTKHDQINFKSASAQPKQPAFVTTSAPVVSVTSIAYNNHQNTPQPLNINLFPRTSQPSFYNGQVNSQPIKFNIIKQISTPSPISQDNFIGTPKSLNVDQTFVKPVNFNQPTIHEVKSYSPAVQVSTSHPFGYQGEAIPAVTTKSTFHEQTNVFVTPSVTSKNEVIGPNIKSDQVSSPKIVPFKEQIVLEQESFQPAVNQNFEITNTKPFTHTDEHADFQVPIQVNTLAPEFKQQINTHIPLTVTTVKPLPRQEELVHISKSIELNPSQIFSSTDQSLTSQQSSTITPVEIQKQILYSIPPKTFSNKEVIQPFYKIQSSARDKAVNQEQINAIPEIIPHGQYVFQQQLQDKTLNTRFYEQKQHLLPDLIPSNITYSPPISYSTAKTTIVEQPVYSEENGNGSPLVPIVPIVQTSLRSGGAASGPSVQKNVLTEIKTNEYIRPIKVVKKPIKTVFIEHSRINPAVSVAQQQVVTPKGNSFLPVTTQGPQEYYSPLSEEMSIQQHSYFEFQKLNKGKGVTPPVKNVFIQPEVYVTSKPKLNAIETSERGSQYDGAQNPATGSAYLLYGSGIKYSTNPHIRIPQPPKEYLTQDIYTTKVKEFTERNTATLRDLSQFKFTSESEFQGPGYFQLNKSISSDLYGKRLQTTATPFGNPDEHGENNQKLGGKYFGRSGKVIDEDNVKFVTKGVKEDGIGNFDIVRQGSSTVKYEVTGSIPKRRDRVYHGGITSGIPATNKYEEYDIETNKESHKIISSDGKEGRQSDSGSSKNVKLDKNKKTVTVVSQVSDANPILVTKLAGQCSCQSNMLELKHPAKKRSGIRLKNHNYQEQPISSEFLPTFKESQKQNFDIEEVPQSGTLNEAKVSLDPVIIASTQPSTQGVYIETEQGRRSSTTATYDGQNSYSILSSLGPDGVLPITPKSVFGEEKLKSRKTQFRGRTRYLPASSDFEGNHFGDGFFTPLLSPVPASKIASIENDVVLKGSESKTQNEIEGGSGKALPGAAFDRYGPGGLRGFDETLQGSIDCKRSGLFRHPKYCNKFYACNYDPWKERFTLHVFNCPIQLTYDSSISACNWPVRGPICIDDNLLI